MPNIDTYHLSPRTADSKLQSLQFKKEFESKTFDSRNEAIVNVDLIQVDSNQKLTTPEIT